MYLTSSRGAIRAATFYPLVLVALLLSSLLAQPCGATMLVGDGVLTMADQSRTSHMLIENPLNSISVPPQSTLTGAQIADFVPPLNPGYSIHPGASTAAMDADTSATEPVGPGFVSTFLGMLIGGLGLLLLRLWRAKQ